MAPKKTAKKSSTGKGFSAEEKAAMRELMKERKANASKEESERAVVAKIDSFKGTDRTMAKRVHAIIKASAPQLSASLWYGMPAYKKEDGKVVCFFQDAAKFKYRYATLGFQDAAAIDEGTMWPVAFALKDLTAADEAKIGALVKKAVR